MDELPSERRKTIDIQDVAQKTVTALAIAVTLGVGTLIWNSVSHGGLVRLLGGVTQNELDAAVSRLAKPGPEGQQGPPGPRGVSGATGPPGKIPNGAVIAFENGCPSGWTIATEAVGSAIVGVGAAKNKKSVSVGLCCQIVGGTDVYGFPVTTVVGAVGRQFAPTGLAGSTKEGSASDFYKKGYDPTLQSLSYGPPVSSYLVAGIKTPIPPSYLPLYYCKQQPESPPPSDVGNANRDTIK